MARLGGPLRVERQAGWPEVNEGITYTERVQGVWAGTLLDWYCSKYAASASREQWKASIEAGTCAVNGQAVCNPDAAVP